MGEYNTLMLLVIALMNAVTAFMAWRTHGNILLLEHNTNSIKDALVAATGKAAHGEGLELGRAEGKAEAAVLQSAKDSPRS